GGQRVANISKTRASFHNGEEYIEQARSRAPQPVKPRHDQHIALIEPLEQLGKLGPVAPSAADLLSIDFRAGGGPELSLLRGQGLVPGRDPRISINRHSSVSLLETVFA